MPKVERLCEQFDAFRRQLQEDNIPCGMLLQASIGHGWVPDAPFAFQAYTNLSDGKTTFTVCPADEGFRDYIRHCTEVMASHHPDLIMVDDDFRLINRPGHGCACPLHMAAFNRTADTPLTREELRERVLSDRAENRPHQEQFVQTQIESLLGAARAMREGIDRVDPTLPGVFCCVGNACEGAAQIAAILAGRGNPVTVRINNGNYTPAGARYFSRAMSRAATQIAVLRGQGRVDAILAETDTCPQNRYSTGAQSLHAHFTGTILEGACGAKHWITRLNAFEPNSGRAYRRILAKNSGFYHALCDVVPTLRWVGCRLPLSSEPDYNFSFRGNSHSWAFNVLERMGIPLYFSAENGGVTCLDNRIDLLFSDEQLREMFSGTVFVDGPAAEGLAARGFESLLGVQVSRWAGESVSGEQLPCGNSCAAQVEPRRLTPLSDAVQADSVAYHLVNGTEKNPLFPGVAVYANPLGGTTVTFCGKTDTPFNISQAFSFLNESRKSQIVQLLKRYGELPLYYPGDAEVYLRVAYRPDGSLFCGFFNIGLDPLDEIELICERPVSAVQCLSPDGKSVDCPFTQEGDALTVHTPAYTLNPVILFLR